MKKIIVKSIMTVIIVVVVVHYALYLKTGSIPWENYQGLKFDLPNALPKSLPQTKNLLPASKTRVYTWVDEKGVTHYSQEPPPADIAARELEVDTGSINIIQGVTVTRPDANDTRAPAPGFGGGEQTPVEKAQEAKALLEARGAQQKKILDSL